LLVGTALRQQVLGQQPLAVLAQARRESAAEALVVALVEQEQELRPAEPAAAVEEALEEEIAGSAQAVARTPAAKAQQPVAGAVRLAAAEAVAAERTLGPAAKSIRQRWALVRPAQGGSLAV
jgi:hypothetical protein